MNLISISEKNLEELRKVSVDKKIDIPYPIYIIYEVDNRLFGDFVLIKCGKYISYFTLVESKINKNMDFKEIKLILEYEEDELKPLDVKFANQYRNEKIKDVIRKLSSDEFLNNRVEYNFKTINKIEAEGLCKYNNDELLQLHKNIGDYRKDLKMMKFKDAKTIKLVGLTPMLDRNEINLDIEKDLELIEFVLKYRKLDIPTYGIISKIKNLLLK